MMQIGEGSLVAPAKQNPTIVTMASFCHLRIGLWDPFQMT